MLTNCSFSHMLLLPHSCHDDHDDDDSDENHSCNGSSKNTNEGKETINRIKLCCTKTKLDTYGSLAYSCIWDDAKQKALLIAPLQELFTQLKSIDKCIKSNN